MSAFAPPLTLRDAIERATQTLEATSPSPRIDAEVLVRQASGTHRTAGITHPNQPLSESMCAALARLIERRQRGEPIAYITGTREFWSLDLAVSSDTLIPRPETELLVERALSHVAPDIDTAIADLGTGSGAIALAFAHERPSVRVTATDRSEGALTVARANATRHGIRNVEFLCGDWFTPLAARRFALIVSNPPYIRLDDKHLSEGDVRFEPRQALVAGKDGLDAIHHLVRNAPNYLLPGGWVLLEHGSEQGAAVRDLFNTYGYTVITTFRDLAGHERVTEARWNSA